MEWYAFYFYSLVLSLSPFLSFFILFLFIPILKFIFPLFSWFVYYLHFKCVSNIFSLRWNMFVMNQVISHKAGTVFLKQNFHELRKVFLVKLECFLS